MRHFNRFALIEPGSASVATVVLGVFFALGGFVAEEATAQDNNYERIHDLARDFSTNANPNGVWWYGWKDKIEGRVQLLRTAKLSSNSHGVRTYAWQLNDTEGPAVFRVVGSPDHSDRFLVQPESVCIDAGSDTAPEPYGVARFTVPSDQAGDYRIELHIGCAYLGPFQGDSDFHLVINSKSNCRAFLAPYSEYNYTNTVPLKGGDTVDFILGRGADDLHQNSTRSVNARLMRIRPGHAKLVALQPTPPHKIALFDFAQDISAVSNPTGPWSIGWKSDPADPISLGNANHRVSNEDGVGCCWYNTNAIAPAVCQVVDPVRVQNAHRPVPALGGVYFLVPDTVSSNYCAIRFKVPIGYATQYRVESAIWVLGERSAATHEFQVLINGKIDSSGRISMGYTNELSLRDGDSIEFLFRSFPEFHAVSHVGFFGRLSTTSLQLTNACTPAPPNVTAHWPMNGSVEEVFGRAVGDGRGSPRFVPGIHGDALHLDGRKDEVWIRASRSVDIGDSSGMSTEFWIRADKLDHWRALLEWTPRSGVNPGVHLYCSINDPTSVFANMIDVQGTLHQLSSPPGVLSTGVFHHIALTYERPSGLARIFVDGELVAIRNLGSFIPDTRHDLWIGRRILGDRSYRFQGDIDELTLFDRALCASEVQGVYVAGLRNKPICQVSETNIALAPNRALMQQKNIAWWSFDKNLIDRVGQFPIESMASARFTNGIFGSALVFDGRERGYVIRSNAVLEIGNASGMAIETWINPIGSSNSCPVIEWNSEGETGVHVWIGVDVKSPGDGRRNIFANLIDQSGISHQIASLPDRVVDGRWHHIVINYSAEDETAEIYMNSDMVAQKSVPRIKPKTLGHLYLGTRPDGHQNRNRFRGLMDELVLHNRALGSDEIRDRYRVLSGGQPPDDMLSLNHRPIALAQSAIVAEKGSILITLIGYDVDGDPLDFIFGEPSHGSLTGKAPNLSYSPNEDFAGLDGFSFSVKDGQLESTSARVSIVVGGRR